MTDLVERLRWYSERAESGKSYGFEQTIWMDAADEIELLRTKCARLERLPAMIQDLNGLAIDAIRRTCKEIMGDNLAFVDDDFARCLLTLRDRCERLRGIIFAHNTALQARCGIGEQEAVACGYRPYFERNGRRCTDCPVYEMIEVGE